ncbi:aldose 1-epimerase [Ralstonia sp. SET104]|uniref:aldose 1-epimerase n=1 Tax=Ralstonia sp. SET104 TaxID=2448774 RepID=UPI000F58A4A5|nr:aldose 1-epimerase [Ralstonia sp. SET104]
MRAIPSRISGALAPGPAWLAPGPVHTLRAGALTMTIAPAAGGRIGSLSSTTATGNRIDWLVPMPDACLQNGFDGLAWPKAGCYPLLPFSNRIRGGRFLWRGREICLAPHPGQAHAMHGIAHARAWQVEQLTQSSIQLSLRYSPTPGGWPWAFFAMLTFVLTPEGLQAEMVLHNESDSDMPAGGGFHPYFARTPRTRVQFDADTVWPMDAEEVATGRRPIGPDEDFHDGRLLPEDSFSVYYGDWHQVASVFGDGGSTLTLRADDPLTHFILHAPGGSPYFCLEPVSHVADALNLAADGWEGTGLRALAPGQALRLTMQLTLCAGQS